MPKERKEPDLLNYPVHRCSAGCGSYVQGEEGAVCESCRLFQMIKELTDRVDELIEIVKERR